MNETEAMRKYAAACGIGENLPPLDAPVRPLPCVRDEGGEIAAQSVKRLFAKIDEELNELKAISIAGLPLDARVSEEREDISLDVLKFIADEAADVITAVTTLCEALGIDAEARDAAQARTNRRNRERGRL